ncbi:ABC transporter related protein [Gemmatirosa kalamazoonensis]|uniref:ABC transporter related protein n=1 Tax=Gemmatirosa kalamazoonensis TaxID=861299 RepID=W0RKX1_9BACT|nr:ABC transporter ATP-binding protein [Gemmatirosa kalamazoonensis]AHG91416.1 ABC transporter related protein [Gemmatirosa kalamazoonensis]
MLRAVALRKRFPPDTRALDNVTFDVADGEVCTLVGHNGAGKTTTMNCFLDFVRPDAGHAEVDGTVVARAPIDARRRLAFLGEQVAVYPALTGRENVLFFVRLAGRVRLSRAEAGDALARFGVPDAAVDRAVATYSKGMRQKVGLAIAAAAGVRNLILDEPTSGLDPAAARDLVALLRRLAHDGCAVLASSHDLARSAAVTDVAVCLARGRVVGTVRRPGDGVSLDAWYAARYDVLDAETAA